MKKHFPLAIVTALLVVYSVVQSIPATKALFTSSARIANNNIGTGNWPSPTSTPTSTPIPTSTPVPTPTSTPIPTPTAIPTPTPNSGLANLRIDPAATNVIVGQTFTFSLVVNNVINLGGFQATVNYNPNIIEYVTGSAAINPFLSSTGRSVYPLSVISNPTAGTLEYGAFSLADSPPGPNGEGILATYTFKAIAAGQSNLSLTKVEIVDILGNAQPNGQLTGGAVNVQ